jgi:hypothetical protein
MRNIVGLWLSVVGIALALVLHYLKITQKLDDLIERQERTLSREQTLALTDLYLSSIQHEFRIEVLKFAQNDLPGILEHNDRSGARNIIRATAQKVIENRRNLVSSFPIAGGVSFKCFLDEVNPMTSDIVGKAVEDTCLLVDRCFDDHGMTTNLPSAMTEAIADAGRRSRQHIVEQINDRYAKRR